jgi:hypothetical protein
MKQFLTYLTAVLVLSVALVSASPGRGDSGPPDIVKVVTNQQTEAINTVAVMTPAIIQEAIDERPQVEPNHVLLMKEKAVIHRTSIKPIFDPFYNERRWEERIRYYITERDNHHQTTYHLRC